MRLLFGSPAQLQINDEICGRPTAGSNWLKASRVSAHNTIRPNGRRRARRLAGLFVAPLSWEELILMNSITQESLELMKGALAQPDFRLAKSISTATGLLAYDLQAPAKNLYPFVTPLRNIVPRVGGGVGSATNWRQVNAIIGSGFDSMGWVPEGQRSGQMSYSTSSKSATFVTLGEEDAATFEAISAGREFEDIQARMTFRLLQCPASAPMRQKGQIEIGRIFGPS